MFGYSCCLKSDFDFYGFIEKHKFFGYSDELDLMGEAVEMSFGYKAFDEPFFRYKDRKRDLSYNEVLFEVHVCETWCINEFWGLEHDGITLDGLLNIAWLICNCDNWEQFKIDDILKLLIDECLDITFYEFDYKEVE